MKLILIVMLAIVVGITSCTKVDSDVIKPISGNDKDSIGGTDTVARDFKKVYYKVRVVKDSTKLNVVALELLNSTKRQHNINDTVMVNVTKQQIVHGNESVKAVIIEWL